MTVLTGRNPVSRATVFAMNRHQNQKQAEVECAPKREMPLKWVVWAVLIFALIQTALLYWATL